MIDLREYEQAGVWSVLRRGAVDEGELTAVLEGRFRFDPSTYGEMVSDTLPGYVELQERLAAASGTGARRILDLGIGTGETSARVLEHHPHAAVTGVDESPTMLDAAAARIGPRLTDSHVGLLQDALPAGEFDLVVSALAIHHLEGPEKAGSVPASAGGRRARRVLRTG